MKKLTKTKLKTILSILAKEKGVPGYDVKVRDLKDAGLSEKCYFHLGKFIDLRDEFFGTKPLSINDKFSDSSKKAIYQALGLK